MRDPWAPLIVRTVVEVGWASVGDSVGGLPAAREYGTYRAPGNDAREPAQPQVGVSAELAFCTGRRGERRLGRTRRRATRHSTDLRLRVRIGLSPESAARR